MVTKFSKILNDINTIVVPELCFGCNARLYRGEHQLCTFCRNQLPLTGFNYCDENPVDRIFYGRIPIRKAASFLYFQKNGIVKNLLHALKYENQPQIGQFLGAWYGEILKDEPNLTTLDGIIPVPLHKSKLRQRGYNQLTEFGKSLSNAINVPLIDGILVKSKKSKTQTHKSRLERSEHLSATFSISDPAFLEGKHILLIDDVITTGATLEACGKLLLSAPGLELYIASIAVVPSF